MNPNIKWQNFKLNEADRVKIKNQQPFCLWMTGLSGAVQSTLANALEEKLNQIQVKSQHLDHLTFAVSRSHLDNETKTMVVEYGADMLQAGSALKLAYVPKWRVLTIKNP